MRPRQRIWVPVGMTMVAVGFASLILNSIIPFIWWEGWLLSLMILLVYRFFAFLPVVLICFIGRKL